MKESKKKKISNINLIEKYYGKGKGTIEYPNKMIYEYFLESAVPHPNYIAYEYFGREVTYQKFIQQIADCAKALKGIGAKEDEVITICTPNIPEAIIMFYAINMIGCIANIIHPLSSENEILHSLQVSNSTKILVIDISVQKIVNILKETKLSDIIVTNASNNMKFDKKFLYWLSKGRKMHLPVSDMIITWNEFIPKGYDFNDEYIVKKDMNDPAVILYSGGTSGTPKGILLSNLNFNALAKQAEIMAQPNKAGDTILCIMPIFHGFGLGVCIHTTLCIGMKCVLIPAFNYKDFRGLIKKYQPNFLIGVPTLFESLMNSGKFKDEELKCITSIISGGDTMSPDMKRRIDAFLKKNGSKAKVRVGYGLTEGTAASCLTIEDELRDHCIGIPFPDVTYKIVKPGTHDEAKVGEDGEICINGPTVMLGYLNDTKETMQTLREHEDGYIWLHTGDAGYKDEEGMIFFEQRLKRIIISSGYNIYPSYIESVIDRHPAVNFSTVIGIDHPYKVQVAKAFIVLNEGYKPNNDTLNSIKKHCEKNIAKYSLPYEYEFRESLPKTKVGKIAFQELIEEEKQKKKKH